VLNKCGWLLGGHICPQQGRGKHAQRRRDRAPRRNKGVHGPVGVAVPSQAPQLACLLPTAHSESHLASVWLKPAAVAIRQSGRSGLLCGVVGEPHKRQARERARSRCNDHGARRMRGKRAVSKAGLCRRQQAGRMGQRRTSKAPEATKSTRPAVPKGPVCMCVHVRADVRAAGTSQVPWVRWETGHKSQGASCLRAGWAELTTQRQPRDVAHTRTLALTAAFWLVRCRARSA
jgi:hypothetical protein